MDIKRRRFLSKAWKVGGLAALYSLGVSHKEIDAFWGFEKKPSGGGNSWATWDETSEAGLASDDTFVVMEENINAGGSETGQGGGLTGADLVLSDVGTVDGATGSPPTRVNVAASGQAWTITALNAMFNTGTWTLIFKANVTSVGIHQYWCVLGAGAAGQNGITAYYYETNTFTVSIDQNGVNEAKASGAVAATGIQWVAVWATGGVLKAGIATTRPTVLADFSTVLTFTTNSGDMSAGNFATNLLVWKHPGGNGIVGNLYYMIASKLCLIA